jgi:hypothetical protein
MSEPIDLKGQLQNARLGILNLTVKIHDMKTFCDIESRPHDIAEMRANITLAYRHMEDARMRLGKAIQAYDGGVSCYPK